MAERKFDFNDKVIGSLDGVPVRRGYVVVISPEDQWPYMIRCEDGSYSSFAEHELEVWDEGKKKEEE